MSSRNLKGIGVFLALWIFWPLFGQAPAPTTRVTVDSERRYQRIDGFGVNFNGTYFREAQKPMIDMLIDDLGATIFRLDPYGISNWESENDNDDADAMNWEYYNDRYSIPTFEASWAAARYLNSRGIRFYLNLSGTAPDWMLDDKAPPPQHEVCIGGTASAQEKLTKPNHLNPAMYDEFAEQIVSMAVYARTKARIDFKYFGPINETDCYPKEGPRVDPQEMPILLGVVARRMKKEEFGDVQLVIAEQALLANNYIGPILKDSELMKQVGVFALHTYQEDSIASQVERVRRSQNPYVRIWLTEYGDLDDRDRSSENNWKKFSLAATRRVLRALNDGANAALFWDAYDNYHEHYPRLTYYGLIRNSDHIYTPKKRYYAAKQLYRFVRPGAQRIAANTAAPGLTVAAFHDRSKNSLVVVGVKEGESNRIQIALSQDTGAPAFWELYLTTRSLDCQRVDTVPVHGGVAEFDLPDEAIFTLIGKRTRGEHK